MSADRHAPNTPRRNDGGDALRQALLALETPEASADFDARVLAAVRGRPAWREVFLSFLRPALATASASAAVTLLLVHVSTRPARPVVAAERDTVSPATRESIARIHRALERDRPTYIALDALREKALKERP